MAIENNMEIKILHVYKTTASGDIKASLYSNGLYSITCDICGEGSTTEHENNYIVIDEEQYNTLQTCTPEYTAENILQLYPSRFHAIRKMLGSRSSHFGEYINVDICDHCLHAMNDSDNRKLFKKLMTIASK